MTMVAGVAYTYTKSVIQHNLSSHTCFKKNKAMCGIYEFGLRVTYLRGEIPGRKKLFIVTCM